MKNKVCNKTRSPPASLLFKGQGTKHTTVKWPIERIHSGGQRLCKFIGKKESVYIRKEFNSHSTCLGHQHGRRFIALGHQYGCRDVRSIGKCRVMLDV